MIGSSKFPKYEGEECQGFFLGSEAAQDILETRQLNLSWLISSYKDLSEQGTDFFNPYFTQHAGSLLLREQIEKGLSMIEIRKTWETDISNFKQIRKKYLLYDDFE